MTVEGSSEICGGIWWDAQSGERVVVIGDQDTDSGSSALFNEGVCVRESVGFEGGCGRSNKRSEVKWEGTNESVVLACACLVGEKLGFSLNHGTARYDTRRGHSVLHLPLGKSRRWRHYYKNPRTS